MIIAKIPEDWSQLQIELGHLLTECGFKVEVEKKVDTLRQIAGPGSLNGCPSKSMRLHGGGSKTGSSRISVGGVCRADQGAKRRIRRFAA
jgi:hypothetical protein